MQTFQFRYTRNFNIKYRKFGHLFQGRYKAILCERDAYLDEELPFVYDIPIGQIVSEVCSVLKIPTESIYSSNRNRLGTLGRAVVGHMGKKLAGHYVKAVAEHFNRDPVAITQGIKKVEEKFRHANDFRQAIEKIEKMLTNKRKKKYLFTYV